MDDDADGLGRVLRERDGAECREQKTRDQSQQLHRPLPVLAQRLYAHNKKPSRGGLCCLQEARGSIVPAVVMAYLAADLAARETVGVNVRVDHVRPQSLENSVEPVLAGREPLGGKREDLSGLDGSLDRPRGTWTGSRCRSNGRRGGIVCGLAKPDSDAARRVLLTEVEMRLVDELGADDRRGGGIGEIIGQLEVNLAALLVDLEVEPAAARAEQRADAEGGSHDLGEPGERGPRARAVIGATRDGNEESKQADCDNDGLQERVHRYSSLKRMGKIRFSRSRLQAFFRLELPKWQTLPGGSAFLIKQKSPREEASLVMLPSHRRIRHSTRLTPGPLGSPKPFV